MPDFCLENLDFELTREGIRSRLRQLHPLLPDARNAYVTTQIDSTGTRHCTESRIKTTSRQQAFAPTSPSCAVGSLRETETTIADLLEGSGNCTKCVPVALSPGSALSVKYLTQTKLLASITDDKFASELDRARTIVKFIWSGNNNALPNGRYNEIVDKILMPELKEYGTRNSTRNTDTTPRILVALTARDIYMGAEDNPAMYEYTVTAAAVDMFYAAKSNSVWLLNVQSWPTLRDFPSGQWSLGTVLSDRFYEENSNSEMCEIFATFCNDALAGSADWADLQHFYTSATILAR